MIEEKDSRDNTSMTKVTFLNEPKYLPHEVHNSRNEKKREIHSAMTRFISEHALFAGKDVSVTFFHTGISSLVSLLEYPEGKVVLKVPLSRSGNQSEQYALAAWKQCGVSVPAILETGTIDDFAYMLQEYIDAPTIKGSMDYEEMIESGTYRQMGKLLQQMHQSRGKGFGTIKDGIGEYSTFMEYLESKYIQDRISGVQEQRLFDMEDIRWEESLEILEKYTKENHDTTVCHGDLTPHNIFQTDPLTVFDPNASFNYPYYDLAKTIVLAIGKTGIYETADQLIEGYFDGHDYDDEVLHAFVVLGAVTKSYGWMKTNMDNVKNIERYLSEKEDR